MADKLKKPLKAFRVAGYEYEVIHFATSNIVARREGANELDEEFSSVSCRRAPEFDAYAEQGRVPRRTLLEEHGWWQECAYCGRPVSSDDTGRIWKKDSDVIFCNAKCKESSERRDNEWHEKELQRQSREAAAIALAKTQFGAVDNIVANGYVDPVRVSFTFPGGLVRANWSVGSEMIEVTPEDVPAWRAFMAMRESACEQ
ncbi:TPA: hypothetical protein UOR20_003923 [Escherichia coli]|nr:hypothetical protein [Escherichia coli]ELM8776599.1 hypothetical protein [Escherichia coli]EMA4402811.1 hypothetical protein [Escherichia coli]HAH8500957.1 hypothetical protein [Escherichia coli]HEL5853146.1 hypothetical protein [Escherichia coli]